MKIHLIAIGGAVMHNLAIALHLRGDVVTGSDDEIYDPARGRLAANALLPAELGWFPEKITSDIDLIILGMHARKDNTELEKAQALGLKVVSYPEFIAEFSKQKKRIVVAGSHGKTTTTAMIMHVLQRRGVNFDYLVGSRLEGFDNMVRLSDAPYIVIEGDEYLASPLDLRPKMVIYRPHIAIITGIAWDHINVFPTFEIYLQQFELLLHSIESDGLLIWYEKDREVMQLLHKNSQLPIKTIPYSAYPARLHFGTTIVKLWGKHPIPMAFFGEHNLANAQAAFHACKEIGITEKDFLYALSSFKGAAKRMQALLQTPSNMVWLDFAHAPSKVKATVSAARHQFPNRRLIACFEMHTFSSLNAAFLPQYHVSLDDTDEAIVFYSPHTFEMKKLPVFEEQAVIAAFGGTKPMHVFTDKTKLVSFLLSQNWSHTNLLLMSSGTFDGADFSPVLSQISGTKAE